MLLLPFETFSINNWRLRNLLPAPSTTEVIKDFEYNFFCFQQLGLEISSLPESSRLSPGKSVRYLCVAFSSPVSVPGFCVCVCVQSRDPQICLLVAKAFWTLASILSSSYPAHQRGAVPSMAVSSDSCWESRYIVAVNVYSGGTET